MKRLVWLIPVLILATVLWVNSLEVDAAADASVILNLGENVTVKPNGCSLSVLSAKPNVVKVTCSGGTAQGEGAEAAQAGTYMLNPGKTLKVKANSCALKVGKNKPTVVKVSCKPSSPTPTPMPTEDTNEVKVGSGGTNYMPATITINAGETVHWVWSGSNHTVTSGMAPTADGLFCSPNDMNCGSSNPSNAGATYDHAFPTAGTFQYFCKVHGSSMKGTVVVNP